ncbi:MAG: M16 family metallopeptidase [Thermodesulfobacteriota bacterium]
MHRIPARSRLKLFPLFLILGIMAAMNTPAALAKEIAPHLHKASLNNGLTVIVKETPGTGIATVQLWVKAGSIYEAPREAGITHLIEHMIFKGTPTRPPGQVAGDIESVGGRINAYTSYEYTVYHATLLARHWSRALDVLTDAVLHSTFDAEELEREKKVVLEEIRMRRDRPNIRLYEELMATAYTTHPYRLPISGSEESVSAISRDDILAYLASHYIPENFTVVVVGDVQANEIVKQVDATLGKLPRGATPAPVIPQEPAQQEPRLFLKNDAINQTHLAIAFPIPAFANPDTPALDVLAHILGNGEVSRLYEALRNDRGIVYRVDAAAFTPHDPGLLEITAVLDAPNAQAVLKGALTEAFRMKYTLVSDEELARAKRNLESDFVFNLEKAEGQARVLGSFEMLAGDPREDNYLEQVRTVTREQLQRVASQYLLPGRITVGFMSPTQGGVKLPANALATLIAEAEAEARKPLQPTHAATPRDTGSGRRQVSFRLENGLRLLVRENPEIPTVAIQAVFPGGLRSETTRTNGAFAFLSELLPKGTQRMSAQEIARAVANMAGSISGFNGKNTFGVKADFLARFTDDGLTLVRDILRTPAFDAAEAEKVRPELLAQLKNQEDSLPSVAFREFNRHLFQGHPYGLNTAGSEEALRAFTVEQLRALYNQHARPDRLVLAVVGDVKAEQVKDSVERLFADWPAPPPAPSALTEESILLPEPPYSPDLVRIPRDKEQVHIIVGFLGTTLSSQDRYGLEVLDTVLSGQSGRLFTELRDKQSLAYSLSSFSLFGLDTGSFGIYIGTSPDKQEEAVRAIWQELYRVRDNEISAAELEKAKNVLISNYQLGLQTNNAQALEMALNETYGLGEDYGRKYVRAIEQVDVAAVQAMARKYILPERHVMITVGNEGAPRPAAATSAPPADAPEPETTSTP